MQASRSGRRHRMASTVYWPMPFRESVQVELCNAATSGLPIAVNSAGVEYEPGAIGVETCYLHANSTTTVRAGGQIYHPMLSARRARALCRGNLLYIRAGRLRLHHAGRRRGDRRRRARAALWHGSGRCVQRGVLLQLGRRSAGRTGRSAAAVGRPAAERGSCTCIARKV